MSREFHVVMTKLAATECRFNILTNTISLQPILLDLLRKGRCDIVTSVDSGTPESFYRVKYMSESPVVLGGRSAFDVAWSHIEAYAEACADTVIVKYVCTRETIAEADLRGFVDLCTQHGVTQVMLSPEIEDVLDDSVTEDIWDAIRRTKELAMARGLKVWFSPLFLKARNMPPDLLDALQITDRSTHSLAVR